MQSVFGREEAQLNVCVGVRWGCRYRHGYSYCRIVSVDHFAEVSPHHATYCCPPVALYSTPSICLGAECERWEDSEWDKRRYRRWQSRDDTPRFRNEIRRVRCPYARGGVSGWGVCLVFM